MAVGLNKGHGTGVSGSLVDTPGCYRDRGWTPRRRSHRLVMPGRLRDARRRRLTERVMERAPLSATGRLDDGIRRPFGPRRNLW